MKPLVLQQAASLDGLHLVCPVCGKPADVRANGRVRPHRKAFRVDCEGRGQSAVSAARGPRPCRVTRCRKRAGHIGKHDVPAGGEVA